MGKTMFIILLFIISNISARAQTISEYTFSQSSGTYSAITGTEILATGNDDNESSLTNIGFNFTYHGASFTQFSASPNGYIRLGAIPTATSSPLSSEVNCIAFCGRDGKVNGGVVYSLSGTSPNQVLTIQYPNWYLYWNGTTNTLSAQIKLYETTNVIEIIYGSSTRATSYNPQVGLIGAATSDFSVRTATTSWATSNTAATNTATMQWSTTYYPASGQTYRWTPPTCLGTPTGVTASAITLSGATISWTAASPAPATGYQYYYSTSSTTPDASTTPSGSVGAGVLNANISGLVASTTYYVWVRSYCGGTDYGSWSSSVSFATPCNAISSFPWTESFEGVSIPAFPSCWYKENGDWITTNNAASTYDADARTGSQFLRESWSATNEYIWTPGFNLTAGTPYDFSFWWAGDTYSGWTGDVFYNTTQVSTGATQMGASFVANATTTTKTYAQVTRTFTPTTSGIYYFAIRVNCPTATPWYLSFDDFRLEQTNMIVPSSGNNSYTACNQHIYDHAGPAGDYANNAEGYSTIYPSTAGNVVQISGTSAGESGWDYVAIYNGVGTGGTLIGTYYMGTAIPTLTSTDASGALTIRFHSDVSVVGAGFNIAISCVPPCITPGVPTNPTATVTGNSTATAAWTAGTPAGSSYYVTVYNATDNSVAIAAANVSGASTSLSGLGCGQTYYYTVYAFSSCGNLTSSIATSGYFTTTAPTSASLPFTEGFNAMPECWGKDYLTGTSSPTISNSSSSPTTTPQEGTGYLYWNSWSISDGDETRFYSPPLSTMGVSNPEVRFFWMNENSTSYNSGAYLLEGVQVQYSTDKVNWTDVVFVSRHDATLVSGSSQWKIKEIMLPLSTGNQPVIYVGLKFHSSYGDNCSLDNLWVGQRYTDPLPIELAAFSGTCDNGLITISWTTASENNNDYFTIEKSDDAKNWHFWKKVKGSGNSSQPITYYLTDETDKTVYYRLKQTDFDGKFEYFPPITAKGCGSEKDFRLYPNPVTDILYIETEQDLVSVSFTDIYGQTILPQTPNLKALNMSDLRSGVYTIKITDSRNATWIFKIIKK